MSESYTDEQTRTFRNQHPGFEQIVEFQSHFQSLRSLVYANTAFIILLMIAMVYLIGLVNKYQIHSSKYQRHPPTQYDQGKKQLKNIVLQYENLIENLEAQLNKLEQNEIMETINSLILQNDRQDEAIDQQLILLKTKIQTVQSYLIKKDTNQLLTTNVSLPLVQPILYNTKGDMINRYLYNASQRINRTKLINKRLHLFQTFKDTHPGTKNKGSLLMVNYILKHNHLLDELQKHEQIQQYNRLEKLYQLSEFNFQLSMCIVGVGRNNADYFRIQANLNSIFIQNYSNYYAVIIDDVSEDGSQQIYQKYFDFYKIPENKYIFIKNTVRKTALENIHIAIHKYCGNRDIFVLVDLDDQVVGKNTFKLFNAFYLRYGSGMVYSNFYSNSNYTDLGLGFTKEYSDFTMKTRSFRQQDLLFSHLRTARIDLYKKIKEADLKHYDGTFYKTFYDLAIFFPIIQMCSCGKVKRINQQTYFYNYITTESDRINTDFKRKQVHDKVIESTPYQCQNIQPFMIKENQKQLKQSQKKNKNANKKSHS